MNDALFIYHLTRESCGYDEVTDVVVIAKDSEEARLLAASTSCDEGREAWLSPSESDIRTIGVALSPSASRVVVFDGTWCG